jgi:hypothetical protein
MQSCTQQDSTSGDIFKDVPVVIDMDSVKTEWQLKYEHIRFVPLETSDSCLIGMANKVLIRDNKIYVADFIQAVALFVFDMNGKFLFKIARQGQGQGEYVSFYDFDIHNNGDIYTFDIHGKKIIVFNNLGKYLHEIPSDYYFMKFCLVENKMYWSDLYENGITFSKLAVYDIMDKNTQFLFKDKKFTDESYISNFSAYKFYYSPDNITYYSPKFSEIIYSVTKDGVYPAIGLKNVHMPSEEIINKWKEESKKRRSTALLRSSDYYIETTYIYETDKYVAFQYCTGNSRDVVIYNKFSKKARTYMSFFEDTGTSVLSGSLGKEFFGVVNFLADNKPHQKILESREELKNWKEDDNPVIVFFNPDM